MEESIIKELLVNGKNVLSPANFHEDKNRLKELQKRSLNEFNFHHYHEHFKYVKFLDKPFYRKDANKLVEKIQQNFIETKNNFVQLMKVINSIISTIDDLDKGYIQGILIAIKSNQVNTESLEKNVQQIRKTVDCLSRINAKIENLESMSDNYYETCAKITEIEKRIDELKFRIENIESKID